MGTWLFAQKVGSCNEQVSNKSMRRYFDKQEERILLYKIETVMNTLYKIIKDGGVIEEDRKRWDEITKIVMDIYEQKGPLTE